MDDKIAEEQKTLKKQLEKLTGEHRNLDAQIAEMVSNPLTDMVGLKKLKKRKLAIKDEIKALHRRLLPDIIA